MSVWFISDTTIDLWNPSNVVADFFVRGVRALETFLEHEAGIGDLVADEIGVDPKALASFFRSAQDNLRHPVMRSQAEGLLATVAVLLIRSGDSLELVDGWEVLASRADSLTALMPQ